MGVVVTGCSENEAVFMNTQVDLNWGPCSRRGIELLFSLLQTELFCDIIYRGTEQWDEFCLGDLEKDFCRADFWVGL